MRLAEFSEIDPSDKYLFRRLVNTKNGQRLRDSAELSYTHASADNARIRGPRLE